jgi:hypothetical protein
MVQHTKRLVAALFAITIPGLWLLMFPASALHASHLYRGSLFYGQIGVSPTLIFTSCELCPHYSFRVNVLLLDCLGLTISIPIMFQMKIFINRDVTEMYIHKTSKYIDYTELHQSKLSENIVAPPSRAVITQGSGNSLFTAFRNHYRYKFYSPHVLWIFLPKIGTDNS